MSWQPIESAPKDGTWFLATVAGKMPDGTPLLPIPTRFAHHGWIDIVQHEYTGWHEADWEPTHWMPLPPPPQEAK